MNRKQFKKAFKKLVEKGYIKSERKGPTGIGHTLEKLTGLTENNLNLPDIDGYELKGHRNGHNCLISLFTLDSNAWQISQEDALNRFGYIDEKRGNRLSLYHTLKKTPSARSGVYFRVSKKYLLVKHSSGVLIARWELERLALQFERKLPALLFVTADSKKPKNRKEEFHYRKAYVLSDPTPRKIGNQIDAGHIEVDLRLHFGEKNSVRNHGTAFRILESNFPEIFSKKEVLF